MAAGASPARRSVCGVRAAAACERRARGGRELAGSAGPGKFAPPIVVRWAPP